MLLWLCKYLFVYAFVRRRKSYGDRKVRLMKNMMYLWPMKPFEFEDNIRLVFVLAILNSPFILHCISYDLLADLAGFV